MPRTQSPEPFDFVPFDFAAWLWLRIAPISHPSTSPANPEPKIARLRLCQLRSLRFRRLRTPSISPRSHPRTARLRLLTLRLRQLRTPSTSLRWHRDGSDRTKIAIEKWLGFDEFDWIWWFFFCWVLFLCLSIEKWYYIFVWKLRKCEGQKENVFSILFSATQPNTWKYFPKHFLECNQTLENIFISRK